MLSYHSTTLEVVIATAPSSFEAASQSCDLKLQNILEHTLIFPMYGK
jgi:hypothetical protein